MNTHPTLAETRARLAAARDVVDAPLLTEHGAIDYHRQLGSMIALLDLYVGKEPTIVEENVYVASELVRLQEVEDRLRRLRLDVIGGTHPDPISRAVLVHQLTAVLDDQPVEAGETA